MKNILFGLIQLVTRGFVHRFFLCIVVLFLLSASLNPTKAYAAKFSIYDKVEVYNTGGVGLRLRQWYSATSSIVTKMPDGTQMTVYGGPYQADGYNWWYLYGYVDGTSYGYSAGYYYGYAAEDYLKLVSASCTYSISPSSQSFSSNGGSGSISVTTSSGCSWTATSNASWITITSGSSVSGNGTVNYSVASNSSTSSRTGTMTIAGQTFTVTQSPASSPPTVTTGTYQTVSSTSVQLFGTVNPNGLSTTGWFQWGTTASYGNTTSAESLGDGTSVVQMLHTISSLTASTTYHFRAVAQSNAGTSYGEDMSFTTEAPAATKPTVTTNAATSVSSTTAMLNGTVNPNGAATTGWFEWGTTSSYGNTTQTFSGGSGTSDITMSWSISSLSPNTTYHFRAVGQNSAGTVYGSDMTFKTEECSYSINPTTQSFDSNGGSGSISVTTSSGCSWTATSNASWITITSGSSVSGNGTVNYSVASNSSTSSRTGTMTIAGQTFTVTQSPASSPPTVTTGTYQTISSTSVQLFGTVNPNGLTTTGWFEWGTTSSYGNTTNKESLGGGTGVVQMLHTISGLTASTTYHFRAVAQSSAGTSYGEDMSFTTEAPAATKPTVTTNAATSVSSTTATLNGIVNPNGASTTGWFEWGTTSSYGNTTQTFSGGSGTSDVTMSWSISSLSPNTTYHFMAVGQNSAGTTYGSDMTFTTSSTSGTPSPTPKASPTPTPEATPTLGENEIKVPGTACPFFAGVEDASDSDDNYTNSQPVEISLPAGVTSITFEVSGKIGNCENCYGSDITTPNDSYEKYGISLISAPINSLIGVFLSNGSPSYSKKPARLSNDGSVPDSSTPAIQQSFFIYHFSTSRSNIATITVPEEATRLFLGGLDGWGWNNNVGSYQVKITWNYADTTTPTPQVTPTPSPSPTPIQSTCTDSYEPNESSSKAYGPLTSGSSYSGKICSGSDVDWFKVNITTKGTISLNLTVPSSYDYDLELYDPSYAWIAGSYSSSTSESISKNITTAGNYYIRISGSNGSYSTTSSYTLTFAFTFTTSATPTPSPTPIATAAPTPSPTTSPEEEDLLEKYAPILYMHPDEQFHPTNVQTMLDNANLYNKKKNKKGKYTGGKSVNLKEKKLSLELLMNTKYNSTEYYLKLKDDAKEAIENDLVYWNWKKDQTVYGRKCNDKDEKGSEKTILQYWFFYVYNDWGTKSEFGNSHEGDWEMIQIILGDGNQPEQITYGFHHGGQTYEWSDKEVGKDESGNHPFVYVTLGGHGCWNNKGEHLWYQEGEKYGISKCLKCMDKTDDSGNILYPENMSDSGIQSSSTKYPYRLENISNSGDGSEYYWMNWKGYWGEQTKDKMKGKEDYGSSGPPSPPYINYMDSYETNSRWNKPIKWSNDPVPERYEVCTSENSKVAIYDSEGNIMRLFEKCTPFTIIAYSDKDLVFDVYSLDGNEVDLRISRHRRTGEEYEVEFNMLEISKSGKASFTFSPEQNPTFAIEIDHDRDGFFDSHRLPDFLEIK